ncbi:MAG: hypothetical protein ACRD94_06520 [Nitrosopumilaceae archaeon]
MCNIKGCWNPFKQKAINQEGKEHKKSIYLRRPILVSCYRFKISNEKFKIPFGDRQYFDIPLNYHTREILSNKENDASFKVNSFVLTANHISISYSKDVSEIECKNTAGIDRNLRNVTVGNYNQVIQYDISKAVKIAENTKSIMSSFKRNDHRIRKRLYSKYGTRRKNRINQMLHQVSKNIIQYAKKKQGSSSP